MTQPEDGNEHSASHEVDTVPLITAGEEGSPQDAKSHKSKSKEDAHGGAASAEDVSPTSRPLPHASQLIFNTPNDGVLPSQRGERPPAWA